MKYAILGDIHANLEALQVVLEDAKKERVTHYACIGDVVGYAANPRECMDIIHQMACPIVKGNRVMATLWLHMSFTICPPTRSSSNACRTTSKRRRKKFWQPACQKNAPPALRLQSDQRDPVEERGFSSAQK